MKKVMALILAFLLCFSMVACGNSSDVGSPSGKETPGKEAPGEQAPGSEDYWANTETMKLAILTPLTGAAKENGDRAKRSVEYAVENINKAGGVLGKDVEAVYFDIGQDQQGFLNALQSAVNTEGISATIGYTMSPFTIAGAEIIRESEIPNITFGNSIGVSNLKNPYIWQARTPDVVGTKVLAKVSHEQFNLKKVAVVWQNNASGQSQRDAYVAAMEEYGATIVADIGYDRQNTSDYSPIITQVMNSGSDGLAVFCTNQEDGIMIAETLKQFNYPHPIGSSSGNFVYSFLDLLSDSAADGWYGVSELNLNATTPGLKEYLAALEEKDTQGFGRPGWDEAGNHDAVLIFAEAAKIAGSTNPKLINDAISEIKDIQGVMSSYSYHENQSLAGYLWNATIKGNDIEIGEQILID